MDEQTIQQIVSFLSKYYGWELIIIGITIGLTFLVKIPIRKAADKYAEKYNVDKSVITWVIGVLPFVFAFLCLVPLYLYRVDWKFDSISWKGVVTETATLGAAAMGVYEFVKKFIQGIKAKKNTQVISKEGDVVTVTTQPRVVSNPKEDATKPSYLKDTHKRK